AHVRALVLEAPQRGVLLRGGGGVPRVHLHDPAEAVRLVLVALGAGVEAGVARLPAALGGAAAHAVALVPLAARGDEVLVEVLLAGQDRAPGGQAAGAVVQGALDEA